MTPGTGAYGAWAAMGSALTDDAYGIFINVNNNSTSGASRQTVIKIGVDEAGGTTYVDRITGLICGNAPVYQSGGSGVWYYFPLFIKSGSTLAVAGFGSVATAFGVFCETYLRPADPTLVNSGAFVETLGITGTAGVTVTPGTTAEGAWVLAGTTTKRCWWWQVGVAIPSSITAHNAAVIHVDVASGDATNKDIIINDALLVTTGGEANNIFLSAVDAIRSVPEGTNIYVRAQSSATAQNLIAAVYGLG